MDNRILNEKYILLETLHSNESNTVYLAKDKDDSNSEHLIINEFINIDAENDLEGYFSSNLSGTLSTFLETFYVDSKFYIVGKLSRGTPISDYLADNNLRLSDKMYIVESFLSGLLKFEDMDPQLVHLLCNLDSISVVGKKNISFNMNLQMSNEASDLVTKQDVIKRIGDVLCCVFANSPKATLESDKDNIPPTMLSIIRKCYEGQYNKFSDIYKSFKASLLFSTFLDSSSINKQIMRNMNKAKRRGQFGFIRSIAVGLLVAAFAFGFWYLKGEDLFRKTVATSTESVITPTPSVNNKPIAKFSSSISKITAGDEVVFINESSDPDINDTVSNYKWTLTRDNGVKQLLSEEKNLVYTFDEPGVYDISLVAKDSNGTESDTCNFNFTVFAKEDIPPSDGTKSTNAGDLK